MANQRINQDEKVKRVNISLPPSTISMIDELTNNGNRSAFIRSLIERAWAEHESRN